jgi:hypothetical protein
MRFWFVIISLLTIGSEQVIAQVNDREFQDNTGTRNYVRPGKVAPSSQGVNPLSDLDLNVRLVKKGVHGYDDPMRSPWIELVVTNTGKRPWFFSRSAEFFGMDIFVRDSHGNRLALNERGKTLNRNALTSSPRRNVDLLPGRSEVFRLPLGDYLALPTGQSYRIEIHWTIHMHPSEITRRSVVTDPSNRDVGFSPTLKSNELILDYR